MNASFLSGMLFPMVIFQTDDSNNNYCYFCELCLPGFYGSFKLVQVNYDEIFYTCTVSYGSG